MNHKLKAMVLAEVIIAFVVCGILMTMSVLMFKSKDVAITPYIFSIMSKLPDVNRHIIEACEIEGKCLDKTLPDSREEYCHRLSEVFTTSTNINCTANAADTVNFKVSNGMSFVNLANSDSWETLNGTQRQYIDVQISTDSNNRTLAINTFPIRIFKNGEVVPSSEGGYNAYDDDEYIAYRVVLNKALDANNTNSRVKEVQNLNRSDNSNNTSETYREKVSFKEAICAANGQEYLSRYFASTDNNQINCGNTEIISACTFPNDYPDKSAYCTVEPVKPRGSGLFKIFGI